MKFPLRVISDIHNKTSEYYELVRDAPYSIQLGDFWGYDILKKLNPKNHGFFYGNHDIHDMKPLPHWLGRYGQLSIGIPSYFIGGGFSVDYLHRVSKYFQFGIKTWWENEELSQEDGLRAATEYIKLKPEIMFSHEAPMKITKLICPDTSFIEKLGFNKNFASRTQLLLQSILNTHKPRLWCVAHLHKEFNKVINGTRFICMPELGYLDIISENKLLLKGREYDF